MKVADGLRAIHERLEMNGARDETLALVDQIRQRAALPSAAPAEAQSLLQLTRMLMRHSASSTNVNVYNDLALLEEQLEGNAAAMAARAAAEADKPMPKTHKYYKELKKKEKS